MPPETARSSSAGTPVAPATSRSAGAAGAPVAPPKRGRGRPRKYPSPPRKVPQDQSEQAAPSRSPYEVPATTPGSPRQYTSKTLSAARGSAAQHTQHTPEESAQASTSHAAASAPRKTTASRHAPESQQASASQQTVSSQQSTASHQTSESRRSGTKHGKRTAQARHESTPPAPRTSSHSQEEPLLTADTQHRRMTSSPQNGENIRLPSPGLEAMPSSMEPFGARDAPQAEPSRKRRRAGSSGVQTHDNGDSEWLRTVEALVSTTQEKMSTMEETHQRLLACIDIIMSNVPANEVAETNSRVSGLEDKIWQRLRALESKVDANNEKHIEDMDVLAQQVSEQQQHQLDAEIRELQQRLDEYREVARVSSSTLSSYEGFCDELSRRFQLPPRELLPTTMHGYVDFSSWIASLEEGIRNATAAAAAAAETRVRAEPLPVPLPAPSPAPPIPSISVSPESPDPGLERELAQLREQNRALQNRLLETEHERDRYREELRVVGRAGHGEGSAAVAELDYHLAQMTKGPAALVDSLTTLNSGLTSGGPLSRIGVEVLFLRLLRLTCQTAFLQSLVGIEFGTLQAKIPRVQSEYILHDRSEKLSPFRFVAGVKRENDVTLFTYHRAKEYHVDPRRELREIPAHFEKGQQMSPDKAPAFFRNIYMCFRELYAPFDAKSEFEAKSER